MSNEVLRGEGNSSEGQRDEENLQQPLGGETKQEAPTTKENESTAAEDETHVVGESMTDDKNQEGQTIAKEDQVGEENDSQVEGNDNDDENQESEDRNEEGDETTDNASTHEHGSTPLIAESTAGSIDGVKCPVILELEVPTDGANFNSLSSLIDHLQASSDSPQGPAVEIVSAMQKEHQLYSQRLNQAKTYLEAKYLKFKKSHEDELAALVAHCKKEKDSIEDKLMKNQMSGPNALTLDEQLPHAKPLKVEHFGKGGPIVEGAKLLTFWKDKYSELQSSCNLLDDELQQLTTKLNDLKYLCSTEQFKVHRVLGLLREKESSERLRAQSYETLLAKFSSNGNVSHLQEVKEDESGNFSIIEEDLLKNELAAVKRVEKTWQSLSNVLLHALDIRSRRKHTLQQRLGDLKYKMETSVSVDNALEEVLELRTKVDEETEQFPIAAKESVDFEALQAELTVADADYAQVEKNLLREIRERKVQVIRALQKSNGDADFRFAHLRNEKCVNVVGNQLSVAEADRLKLKNSLATAASEIKTNLLFLEKC